MPHDQQQKATILFNTIAEVIGRSANLSLECNFFQSGGNSLNSIYTISRLRDRGYVIDIADFISAANLKEILVLMKEVNQNREQNETGTEHAKPFIVEPLKMEHKSNAVQYVYYSPHTYTMYQCENN